MAAATHTIEVLSKKPCVQCDATYRALDKKHTAYTVGDVTIPANREFGLSRGLATAPIVIVRDEDGEIVDVWGGFNPGKVAQWAGSLPTVQIEEEAVAA